MTGVLCMLIPVSPRLVVFVVVARGGQLRRWQPPKQSRLVPYLTCAPCWATGCDLASVLASATCGAFALPTVRCAPVRFLSPEPRARRPGPKPFQVLGVPRPRRRQAPPVVGQRRRARRGLVGPPVVRVLRQGAHARRPLRVRHERGRAARRAPLRRVHAHPPTLIARARAPSSAATCDSSVTPVDAPGGFELGDDALHRRVALPGGERNGLCITTVIVVVAV